MKKINLMIAGALLFYLTAFLFAGVFLKMHSQEKNREYLVEVNRIMYDLEKERSFSEPDLSEMQFVSRAAFLRAEDMEDLQVSEEFFRKKNGVETYIQPFYARGKMLGLVRFDYRSGFDAKGEILFVEGIISVSGIFILIVLCYIRNKLIKPFLRLSNMPYELSKGHLLTEIEENESRFFGKFIWGISMLRDNLKASKAKELQLEKDKKLLLLSLSHDIKTPLNSIKLYARAFQEGIYDTEEKKIKAAGHIEKLTDEIGVFVQKIVKNSSEEIMVTDVENTEFYLKDFVKQVREYYEPKCRLLMTEFAVGGFDNKLLKGSRDGAFEAVENIMENAFKYGDGKRIELSFYEEECCQLIKIRNTGEIVKDEEMPRLFDSFYRGSNAGNREGNGLGLYICREIMRKMEGEIFACQEEDGMSFHLVFHI